MPEKNYKKLYENTLEKNKKLKEKVTRLNNVIHDLQIERFSCDIEFIKGELFGRKVHFCRIEGKKYVKVELWTTDSGYNGHLIGLDKPKAYIAFLRCDDEAHPIPSWCEDLDLNFVITQENLPRVVLNPEKGQPVHILIHGDVCAWEGWHEELVSNLQLEHDKYYLGKCEKSALEYCAE